MSLEDVKHACFKLDSDKVTDRKTGSDDLRNILNNSYVLALLDSSPENGFTWNSVFSYVKSFFVKEARKLEEEERKKPDASQSVLSNRANMKRKAAALPKLVLMKASSKTPHISPNAVIDLVLLVLDRGRPYLLRNFAGDFIQLAQKYLFRFSQHTSEIPPDKLKELLRICIWVYEELPNSDGVSITGVLEGIVRYCRKMQGSHTDGNTPMIILRPFPSFLKRALANNKLSTQHGLQSSLLSLLLTFTQTMASEWRQLICSIGEETFNYVLAMWDNRPSSRQSQLLEYLNLLIIIHDPQEDGFRRKEGSHASDAVTWQRCLHRLYQLIHDHLSQLSAKNKLAVVTGINSEQQTIPQNLVLLTARLCSRIFQDTANYGVLDITQQGSTQMNADMNVSQSGKASKRRRIEVGLQPLTALLREEGMHLHMIPWYQILFELLSSYSAFFDQERSLLMLEVFTYTLGESRTPAVQEHIIQCLGSLAKQYNKVYSQGETQDQLRSGKWTPVWDLTMRLVSGKQCSKHGLDLLQILMKTALVSPDLSVFKLFYQGYVDMNAAATSTLLVALRMVPLPKTFKNDLEVLAQDQVQEARTTLRRVLLPLDIEGTSGIAVLENPSFLAQVLMLTCLRDSSSFQEDTSKVQQNSPKEESYTLSKSLSSLEDCYLLSSFSKALPLSIWKNTGFKEEKQTTDLKIIPQEKQNMLARLDSFINQLMAVVYVDVVGTQKYMEALLQVLDLVVSLQLYIPDAKLESLVLQITRQIDATFQKLWREPEVSRWTTLLPLLNQFSALYCKVDNWARYEKDHFTKNNGENVRMMLMSNTPLSIFPLILDTLKTRTTKSALNVTQVGATQHTMNGRSFTSTRNAADDSFDMDFDDLESSHSAQVTNDFEQFENEKEESSESIGDQIKLDDIKTLSTRDQCLIASLKVVALTHGYLPSQEEDDSPLLEVAELLEQFCGSNHLELCDVPIILNFAIALFSGEYDDANIQDGCVLLSSISRKYSSETQVASFVIRIIADLLREHGSSLSDGHKRNVVCLSQGFAQKHQNGSYSNLVDEAFFQLTAEMTKLDPEREWCKYGTKNNDTVGELYHMLGSTSHELRIMAARSLHLLLVKSDGSPMDTHHQGQMFRKIYESALGNINVQTSVPDEFAKDEKSNRIATLLLTLGIIAANSPYLEAKSLFAMCFWTPDKEADSTLVARVVTRIAESQGKTLKALARHHLPYLAKEWIQHSNAIETFPFSLLECTSSETFIQDNIDLLVPVLFECDEISKIQNLAEICGQSTSLLLQDCFPALMAYIFPPIAAEGDAAIMEHLHPSKIHASKKHYKFLEKSLGSELLNSLLDKHIDKIVLELFYLVHNPSTMVAGEVIVSPNPPHFPPDVIEKTLQYLGGLFGENNPLVSVLATRGAELINVMVGVLGCLARSSTLATARRALSSIEVLVHALLPHLGQKLKNHSAYIINTLVHTLTFYTEKLMRLAPYLSDKCNDILHSVCVCAIELCPGNLASVIPALFTRLLPLTKESSTVRDSTLQIMKTLVMCEQQEVQKAVAYLPPLPDKGDYKSLAQLSNHHGQVMEEYCGELTLYDEVERFMALSREQIDAHAVSHLLKLIRNSKSQVKQLYSSPDMEDVTLGHRLTHCLMSLISTADDQIALEASKCLGELGPVHLNTPIFYVTKEKFSELSENVQDSVTQLIIKTLNRYLMSEQIDVNEAASSSLLCVLSTRQGYKVLQEMGEKFQQDLLPYIPKHKPKAMSTSLTGMDADHYEQEVGQDALWLSGTSYEEWVIHLACKLIEAGCGNDIISHVLPVCRVKSDFSALMLPYIIHSTLLTDNGRKRDVLSRKVSLFFQYHVENSRDIVDARISGVKDVMCLNKSSLHVLLNVVDYLRSQPPERTFTKSKHLTPWEKNWWLQVDYLTVAQAAHYCGAHFSAILYLHLSSEQLDYNMKEKKDKQSSVGARQLPPLQRMSHLPEGMSIRRLMLQIYSSLGDSDGVEGCGGGSKLTDSASRALRYQHRGQWMETLAIHDAAKSAFGMINSLQELGFFNTLNLILNGSSANSSPEVSSAQWESAWRLKQWDSKEFSGKMEDELHVSGAGAGNFHKHFFHCLQSLHHQELGSLHQHAMLARQGLINQIKNSHAESSSSVYPVMTQLQILSEVEAASLLLCSNGSVDQFQESISELETIWATKDESFCVDFSYKEPILAARISLLQSLTPRHTNESCSLLHKTLLSKSTLSRESLKISGMGCESALLQAAKLEVSKNRVWMASLEEAQVARCKGDSQHAGQILSSLLEEMEGVNLESEQEEVFCQSLNLYGCILMDSRERPPNTIIKEYFNRAVDILESKINATNSEVLENSYHQLALYGDKLYREIHQYLESDTIQSKRENIKRSKEECKRVQNLFNSCKDLAEKKEISRKNLILQKNIAIDMQVLRELEEEEQEYIYLALKNYLKCLLVSSKHDLHIHRVVALWLENPEQKINKLVHEFGSKMKSYKFVPLIYQLVARLTQSTDKNDNFPLILFNLLKRACQEHPHHCLPVVMALANAHADDTLAKSGGRKNKSQGSEISEEDRVQAAKQLVNSLKKTPLADHVTELERVCLAYLTLANWVGTKDKYRAGEKVKISSGQPLLNLGSIIHTAALTRPQPLQPSGYYTPPVIVGFEPICTFVGGINAPKRLTLKTSDGLKQYELLKGKDDIRQDAVMEQVFGIVNELLAKNSETRDRSLSVRTYQVVPLSQKSGLIQWCDNTQAFGEYLTGPNKASGAHKLYYPDDYTAITCRELMARAKGKSLEAKYEVFEDILQHFHPVFRHFFYENYPSPHEWYKRRLAYTRSVATNSMVGYILGLGDRHVENILLDKSTAELIHIDLGIAFELGKILPTPETVPFRLTQDVQDGLGVMGVEGPLRRCCEATLGVLRNSGEVLVTVVEVLRHDPLHQWTLSPHQIARLQENEDEEQEIGCASSASMADRVVLRVQQKLAGVENGFARSVPEQVTVLIQQATDISNLSRLFQGWQPYL